MRISDSIRIILVLVLVCVLVLVFVLGLVLVFVLVFVFVLASVLVFVLCMCIRISTRNIKSTSNSKICSDCVSVCAGNHASTCYISNFHWKFHMKLCLT